MKKKFKGRVKFLQGKVWNVLAWENRKNPGLQLWYQDPDVNVALYCDSIQKAVPLLSFTLGFLQMVRVKVRKFTTELVLCFMQSNHLHRYVDKDDDSGQ